MSKRRTRLPTLTTLDTIKEALEVRLGRRGDKLDAAVTFRDLEESGGFRVKPVAGGGGAGGLGLDTITPDMSDRFGQGVDLATWVPAAPKGFAATAMMGGIFIEWNWPEKYGAVGYTEVYRSKSNTAESREFLTLVEGLTYMDQIDGADETEYFYWIRFRSLGDKVGPFAGPVSAVSVPTSAQLIERLQGEIDETLLAQHLRERVDLIDGEGGLVQQVQEQGDTFAEQITQVQSVIDNEFAALQQTVQTQYNETSQRFESIYSLRINNNGRVSGFGLADDGEESVFGVEADRFYVGNDVPFSVSYGRTYIKDAVIRDASIDNAKIADGAITNAKIANASIDFAKISNVQIGSADIRNAAITSAKIDDAAVGTLKLGGSAVINSLAYTTNSTVSGGGYFKSVVDRIMTIAPLSDDDTRVVFTFTARVGYTDGAQRVSFRMYIDGREVFGGTTEAFNDYVTFVAARNVSRNSSRVNVRVAFSAPSSVKVESRAIVAMGVKR